MSFTSWFLPCIVVFIVIFGLVKKIPVFDLFLDGAKDGAFSCIKILPAIIGLMVSISMLKASGALDVISYGLSPLTRILGIPKELVPLALLRPVSGSGALTLYENILSTHGADSFIGRAASVLQGSTETTFYTIAVYYGSVGVKKSRHTLGAALTADFASFVLSSLTVSLFFVGLS